MFSICKISKVFVRIATSVVIEETEMFKHSREKQEKQSKYKLISTYDLICS